MQTPTYLLADLNAHHDSYDHITDERGTALFSYFLAPGLLNVMGPETGTFVSPKGVISKPDLVIANNKCHLFYLIDTLDKNLSPEPMDPPSDPHIIWKCCRA